MMQMQRLVRCSSVVTRRAIASAATATLRAGSSQHRSLLETHALPRTQELALHQTIAVRAFSTGTSTDEEGLRALKRAKELIEDDDIERAMGFLSVAANEGIAEAQYLLGGLLLDDGDDDADEHISGDGNSDSNDDDDIVLDAETKRQQTYCADGPQDIRSIRKSARKAYKEYLQSHSSATPVGRLGAQASKKKQKAAAVVQHASVSELDRAFGTTLKQFLDPKSTLRPLDAQSRSSELEQFEQADSTKAVEWLRRAADNNHRDALVQLGNLCLSQEPPLAFAASEWYSRACSARDPTPHPDALYNLGLMLYDGVEDSEPPFPASRSAAVPYFVKAAEVGDASAQFFMGHLLHQGDKELGIEANIDSALLLIRAAADKGHGGAHFYLAQLYRSGDPAHGITADQPKFLEHLDAAMELEDEDALFCMADMYFHGSDEFPEDVEQARRFYRAAAEAGSADAFCCLGTIYYNGVGVKRDYERAFYYYQEAADRHSLEAWKNLAEMYTFGRGVPRNEATAESILQMLRKAEAIDDAAQ